MNSTVLRCKRETAENETKSGAHTWQRDCAHARLVTRDGEIEITVTVARAYVRTVGRINSAPVARLGGLAPARPITSIHRPYANEQNYTVKYGALVWYFLSFRTHTPATLP